MSGDSRRQAPETVALTTDLLELAAELFVANYERARERQPLLPACHADRAEVLRKLTDLTGREEGVAVLRDGRVIGYGIGFAIGEWHGWRSALMPEWGHATVPEGRPGIYRTLYAALSRRWAADGRFCHLVCMPADDAPLDEWQWMGFGLQCVDALRGIEPAAGPAARCEVHRAGPEDAGIAAVLQTRLREHLSDGPVFLPAEGTADPGEEESRLADPERACFLALVDGKTVGFLSARSANPDAGWIIQEPGKASVDGAYTLPQWRGRGVATALLNAAITWARDSGYLRCAVDFESHNAAGCRFWLRHFEPAAYSVVRHVRLP